MYLVIIAWMYVVLMMSVAEATNTTGTLLGAIVTFFMYGVGPAGLVAYLMGTPARKRAIKKREAQALAAFKADTTSSQPDTGGHSAGGLEPVATVADVASVSPVRKEP
jgi:hypothetical protein